MAVAGKLTMFACDNCVVGDDRISPALLGAATAATLLGVVVLASARRYSNGRRRITGTLAALALFAAFPVSVAMSFTSVTVSGSPGLVCGGALSASREHGVPDDRALDPDQRACKAAGTGRVRRAQLIGITIASLGLSAAGANVLRRRQPLDKSRPERTSTLTG